MNEEKEKPVLCFSQKRNFKITNQSLTFSLKMRKQLLIFVLSISLAQGLYFGHKRNPVRSSNMGPFIKDVINRGGRGVCQNKILLNKLIK